MLGVFAVAVPNPAGDAVGSLFYAFEVLQGGEGAVGAKYDVTAVSPISAIRPF